MLYDGDNLHGTEPVGRLSQSMNLAILLLFFSLAGVAESAQTPASPQAQKRASEQAVEFVDVTRQAGIDFRHQNFESGQKYYVETIGAGCAFFDYDQDGYLDIYLVNGAPLPGSPPQQTAGSALYRNRGDGAFLDVTEKAGVAAEGLYGMGVAVGDYDRDGHEDLYVTGFGRSILYRNNGDSTFSDVTKQARAENAGQWGASAAFLDYDSDGDVDLFVANYVEFRLDANPFCGDRSRKIRSYCHPRAFEGSASVLYQNQGDGTFRDVSATAGIANPEGKGMGVVIADIDGDGLVDIFQANDGVANFFYRNNGDGTFTDLAVFAGVAYGPNGEARAGMGTDVADFNGDGRPDILVTNFALESASLFRNDGDGFFSEVSSQTGVRKATLPHTGWGTKFIDYDNDGDLDIFIANGHPDRAIDQFSDFVAYAQPKLLLENRRGKFIDVSGARGAALAVPAVSRGVAFGDYDNDGDIDVLIANNNGAPALLRNEGGNRNHWIKLKLIATQSHPSSIGAKITVTSGDLRRQDQVRCGASYMAANDPRVHFGLGPQPVVNRIEVRWPSGTLQTLDGIEANQILTIREPAETSKPN